MAAYAPNAIGLVSFKPDNGPMAGIEIPLPLIVQEDRYISTNYSGQHLRQVSEGVGSVIGSGTGMMFPAFGVADVTFLFTPNLVKAAGYQTADLGGVRTATADLRTYLVEGGTGTLRENMPPNTYDTSLWSGGFGSPVPGSLVSFRTCKVIIDSEPKETPDLGVMTVEVNFKVPSCYWTNSTGSIVLFGY